MQQTSHPQNKVPTNLENVFNSQTLALTNKNKYSTVICLMVLPFGRAQLIATSLNFLTIIFTPVLNKSFVSCDFSKWFVDYLKNANEFKLFVVVDI